MASPSPSTPIQGSERPRASGHTIVGPVDPKVKIGVTLLIRPKPGSPPLPDLAYWEKTPPGRRRFPTPAEYAATYGASQADLDDVAAFAKANGLTVSASHAGRRSVHVEGTAAQLNAAFGITLNHYTGSRPASRARSAAAPAAATKHTHHGYDGPVHLPATLIGVVQAVIGLDNRHLGDSGGSSGDPTTANPLPVPTVCGYYNFPNTGASDQTIGVIAPSDPPTASPQRLSGYSSTDINSYFSNLSNTKYSTVPTLKDIGMTVGTNSYSNGGASGAFSQEISQDISTTATVAQGATVNVYFTELSEQGLAVCLNRILLPNAGENQPTVVTCSFNFTGSDGTIGSPSTSGSVAAIVSGLFQQLAAVGINVCIIAQDNGSDGGVGDGSTHVVYPGSDPWVTCVGGTVIGNVNNGPPVTFTEVVWSNITSSTHVGGFAGATGGGASAAFPVPSYQSSAGITQITDTSSNTTKNQRFVPDVSAMVSYGGTTSSAAADNFYFNGSPSWFTGTSCACPLVAGLIAVLRSALGVELGFLNPTLYQLGNSVFNDITSGNNEPLDSSTPFYKAGNNWDPCTGWGSIDGTKLLNGLAGLMYTQTLYFSGVKDNYGLDEVQNVLTYPQAFYLTLDGFTPAAIAGLPLPTLSGAFATTVGVGAFTVGTPQPELPSQTSTPQRIQFPCQLTFTTTQAQATTTTGGIFPTVAAGPNTLSLTANFSVGGQSFSPTIDIQLLPGEDPFFTNVTNIDASHENAFYLSQDLRVFTVTPGINASPIAGVGTPPTLSPSTNTGTTPDTTAAINYIKGLLNYLNANYNTPGADPFALFPDQTNALTGDSSVTPTTINASTVTSSNPAGTNPFTNYNFAVARVRLNGAPNSSSVKNVRVFFRLFTTQSNDTDFQPNTTYQSSPVSSTDPNPGSPLLGTSNTTIPFFATGNLQAAPVNVDYSANSVNNQPIPIGSTGQAWAYYGCFLNIYSTSNTISISGKNVPVQSLVTGTHHCIVAQIAFDDSPIQNSNGITKSPENSDKLAQRNLQITTSDNPGPPATHRIPQTFDLRPSAPFGGNVDPLMNYPDELMIDWGNTPVGSTATIYWPQVNSADVLSLAKQLYSTHQLSVADANTIQCKTTKGLTYVPIPAGIRENIAGLFTVDLPSHVKVGQQFNIVVRRFSSRQIRETPPPPPVPKIASVTASTVKTSSTWRYVVGSFAVTIPVTVKDAMLLPEENTLAILKWRLTQFPATDRWYPVLQRYTDYIAGRVDGLGGNSGAIPPSPTGVPPILTATVKVEITFPPNFQTFLARHPIEVRGNATWTPSGPSPISSMQLSVFESRWNGFAFGSWRHVDDYLLHLKSGGTDVLAWKHVVVPFDGKARYMLTAYAFDPANRLIGSSDPLFLKSVEE